VSRRYEWIMIASILVELAPVLAAAYVGRALTRPLFLVALCWLLMFGQDVAMWWMATHGVHNLWLSHLGIPVRATLLLFAFTAWQTDELSRVALRIANAGFFVLWLVLYLLFEDPTGFSRFASPIHAILLVAVSAYTIVRRSQQSLVPALESDWFWVGAGVLLYFAASVVISPVSRLLMVSAPELVIQAVYVKAIIYIVAYLLIARGVLCLLPLRTSGGYSSPALSSPSSSPPPSSPR
jgi:hypothetical protein